MRLQNLKLLSFALAFITLTFTACKDDDKPSNNNNGNNCRVSKIYYYDQNVIQDSAVYTYTNDRVTKVQAGSEYYTLEYNGNNFITKRSLFDFSSTTTPYEYHQISYNADNSISKIEFFEHISGTTFSPYYRYEFSYNSGKISKVIAYDISSSTPVKEEEYTYTYSGNNITGVNLTLSGSMPMTIPFTYNYDATNNLFKKQGAQSFLIDPLFLEFDGTVLPLVYSANNATQMSYTSPFGSGSVALGYVLDDKQNLRDLKVDNDLAARYNYLCQ